MLWKYCAFILYFIASGSLGGGVYSVLIGDINAIPTFCAIAFVIALSAEGCRRQYEKWAVYLRTPEAVAEVPYRDNDDYIAQVPFMITNSMKRRLIEMGYTAEEVAQLTPENAHKVLKP